MDDLAIQFKEAIIACRQNNISISLDFMARILSETLSDREFDELIRAMVHYQV